MEGFQTRKATRALLTLVNEKHAETSALNSDGGVEKKLLTVIIQKRLILLPGRAPPINARQFVKWLTGYSGFSLKGLWDKSAHSCLIPFYHLVRKRFVP